MYLVAMSTVVFIVLSMVMSMVIGMALARTCRWKPGRGPDPALYLRVGVDELILARPRSGTGGNGQVREEGGQELPH